MSTELIINASLPETRIALMENGEIQDLLIERATGKGIVGNIYKGRVTRVLPGMQAAFVDIGLEKAAFLYVDDVFVHSEIWEAEEGGASESSDSDEGSYTETKVDDAALGLVAAEGVSSAVDAGSGAPDSLEASEVPGVPVVDDAEVAQWESEVGGDEGDDEDSGEEDEDDGEEDEDEGDSGPVAMGPPPGDDGQDGEPQGTVRPKAEGSNDSGSGEGSEGTQAAGGAEGEAQGPETEAGRRRRHRRGRRGGRFRKRTREEQDAQDSAEGPGAVGEPQGAGVTAAEAVGSAEGAETPAPRVKVSGPAPIVRPKRTQAVPEKEGAEAGAYQSDDSEEAYPVSDRSAMSEQGHDLHAPQGDSEERGQAGRPEIRVASGGPGANAERAEGRLGNKRPEFKESRGKDRRIKAKPAAKPVRGQAQIQDLLKEGQEVIVQVAKDPIATKGARLTCHISLPGRHLVCMPTIDHVGVSRRIDRDDERRKLRDYVERNRPKGLGFIVRTASGRGQSEKRIKQDIDYLTRLWSEIREKAGQVTAPALVYEDLNSVLRAIRDWVTEDIDKVIVDSRYHHNDILRFVSHFMPSLKQKVELYNGDIPIFDAYNISTELARGMERKVWLKSGGYLVIDQAEALVAIDVNTGRFVGKKNLEDTILKTNLEAVQEIAYQLRLRNCGGIIILDLIDMEREENKQRVYRALEEALKKDRARPSILKISELGLVEMTRKRTRDTMVRALCESCSHCEGKGFVKSKVTMAYEIMRELERVGIERDMGKVLVQAHPDVIDVLAIDERDSLDQLERRYRKPVYLQAVVDYPVDRFEVTGDKLEKGERALLIGADRGADRDRPERGGASRDRGGDRDRGRGRNRDRGRSAGTGSGGSGGGGGASADRDRGGRDRGGRDRQQSGGRGGDRNERTENQSPVDAMSYVGTTPGVVETPPRGVIITSGAANRVEAGSQVKPQQGRTDSSDDFNEEDRLAFLRAQATQDAALAKMGGAAPGAPLPTASANPRRVVTVGRTPAPLQPKKPDGVSAASADNDDAGGDRPRGRRGRRGGRHRRGGRPGEDRGPNEGTGPNESRHPTEGGGAPEGRSVAEGAGTAPGQPTGTISRPRPIIIPRDSQAAAPSNAAPSGSVPSSGGGAAGGGSSSGESGGSSGEGNGGGNHSTPPVT